MASLWTVGHSTRTWDEFLGLLRENGITHLVDVRHYPSSARVLWTNRPALAEHLAEAGIDYTHVEDLGGYRTQRADSDNTGWRNAGFRGYADHMGTDAFRAAVVQLIDIAKREPTAIMCAEAVPWRCHRGLLADALLVRGVRVIHILSAAKTQEHALTPFAKVRRDRITYPSARAKRK